MIHTFKIPCNKQYLKDVRTFVSDTLHGFGVADIEVGMLVLAVDEVCANRIIHSNQNDDRLVIEVQISNDASDGGILFQIIDSGLPFDHSSYTEPDVLQLVKDKRKGGLGLMLVKRIVDSIEVTQEDNLTVCRMIKKLPLAS